jgi:hypothetical protein
MNGLTGYLKKCVRDFFAPDSLGMNIVANNIGRTIAIRAVEVANKHPDQTKMVREVMEQQGIKGVTMTGLLAVGGAMANPVVHPAAKPLVAAIISGAQGEYQRLAENSIPEPSEQAKSDPESPEAKE